MVQHELNQLLLFIVVFRPLSFLSGALDLSGCSAIPLGGPISALKSSTLSLSGIFFNSNKTC